VKNVMLVMFISALLVTLGLAQTPDAVSNTDPATVKGCLGGSDGNYTVAEDGTRQIVKISTSSVDLKPHLGHDVKLVGHKASGAATSGAADNSFAVTELNMISEHCAAAAAAPVATVIPPSETVIAPDASATVPAVTATAPTVDAAAPATPVAAAPAAAVASTPTVDAAAPAAPVTPSAATVVTPVVEAQAVAPAATASPSPATVSSPAVEAAPAPRPSAHARKVAAQAAAATAQNTVVSPSPEPAGTPAADAAAASTAVSAPETAAPDAGAPDTMTPAPKETHRASSLPLLIAFVVLIIVLGTTAPLIGRWRKRKMLERDGSPNLSFTNEESAGEVIAKETISDDKPEPRKVA
jgi:hypothetical protein